MVIRRAKALANLLDKMDIFIRDHERIVVIKRQIPTAFTIHRPKLEIRAETGEQRSRKDPLRRGRQEGAG